MSGYIHILSALTLEEFPLPPHGLDVLGKRLTSCLYRTPLSGYIHVPSALTLEEIPPREPRRFGEEINFLSLPNTVEWLHSRFIRFNPGGISPPPPRRPGRFGEEINLLSLPKPYHDSSVTWLPIHLLYRDLFLLKARTTDLLSINV